MDNTDTTRTASDSPKNEESKSKKKTPHNKIVGYILSIIAFAFAIASFWTTKKGMQDYIFKNAIGVFVSFGVQAMLFCLSMTIPKYWRVLRTLTKTIMSITLIILIIISSGFTYVYAVDDVYKSTKFINSGNSIVQQHSKELKDAKEYVDAAMKYYRLKMSETITDISKELGSSDTANSSESATPAAMSNVTPAPSATPTPNGIPDEITLPMEYADDDLPGVPGAVFYAVHVYLDTDITVIVVAKMDKRGNVDEKNASVYYLKNTPATYDECVTETKKIDEYIGHIESHKEQEETSLDEYNSACRAESLVPRTDVTTRYNENILQYSVAINKLKEIKSNIKNIMDNIATIHDKGNELLAEILKEQNADIIIEKTNELKEFITQKRETLSGDVFDETVNFLQQISVIADDYRVLMEIKNDLDRINTDYSDYLEKVANAQKEANATATPKASATVTTESSDTDKSEATATAKSTPKATPTAKPTATPEVTATAAQGDDNTATPEATATAESTSTPNDWYDYSNDMLTKLAATIRRIPRVEFFADSSDAPSVDSSAKPSADGSMDKELRELIINYNPIEHAEMIQDMIRNEIAEINLLEKAFRRLFYEDYKTLAWITLVIAFVCDLTSLGAGIVNNSLAIHNLNPKRAAYEAAIENIRETRKGEARMNRLQLKKNRIERRHEVRTAVQNKLWDLWERFLVFLHLCEDDSTKKR